MASTFIPISSISAKSVERIKNSETHISLPNFEDLSACSICGNIFDEETRIAKYLPCLCTFCLPCLQVSYNNVNIFFNFLEKLRKLFYV